MKEIISQLETERLKQGLSYQKLGEKAHTTRLTAWRTLTGRTEPEGILLMRLVDALGFELIMLPKGTQFTLRKQINNEK